MREDLIERLEACANFHDLTWSEESLEEAVALLREAAAALEAAREDAARYQWLRDRMAAEEIADETHAMIALRVAGPIAKRPADPDYCGELDDAIDQARGKGGGE